LEGVGAWEELFVAFNTLNIQGKMKKMPLIVESGWKMMKYHWLIFYFDFQILKDQVSIINSRA
jgi:hypothetical protein